MYVLYLSVCTFLISIYPFIENDTNIVDFTKVNYLPNTID